MTALDVKVVRDYFITFGSKVVIVKTVYIQCVYLFHHARDHPRVDDR